MYSAKQLHYLQAMGIPAWQSRQSAFSPIPPATAARLTEPPETQEKTSEAKPEEPVRVENPVTPADDLALADWLQLQPMQMTTAGQAALWGSSDSGLLVLSECLPESDSGVPVTQPFYGPHGKMLDAMLKGINLSRRDCNIAALADSSAAVGEPLVQLLEQLKPRLVLFFCSPGGCNGRVDFNDKLHRGLLQIGPSPCIVSYHPHYLLSHPESKRDAWEDLKRVRQLLGTG